ncbi:MarR family winged helix-turn-helix transcriptional regulator [Brevundimonas subvibrioides]|uniref:Regulatory protein MarR n=1 Tax=Brevundimonas subvibrioides (strain ATCC 15264 / DSM 4735 / LMG 14903 / NBRC 16000 / CB 81) TaxID=633149 RepID=D9QJN6_BRESC|nr:MarR family transcriptional regulator [Brevundimonas subvibrioides]ADK99637.1 regulatory protein MarR [Brevundimonas subvibrioides ATCC 15264]
MVKSGKQARRAGTLADSPSHLMHRVLQLALDIYSEEAGSDGPTQRQFAVMEAVSVKSGLTQTDLVKATGIDRSTLADLVARMTTKGLLARERSSLDARAMAVSLSDEGKALLEAARPRVEAADKRIMGLLPKGKRDVFLELLGELAASADAAPEQAKADAKALKKAQKEARKAEKAARKAAEPAGKVRKAKKAKVAEPVA